MNCLPTYLVLKNAFIAELKLYSKELPIIIFGENEISVFPKFFNSLSNSKK